MATVSSLASFPQLFKETYTDRVMTDAVTATHVMLDKCAKAAGLSGAHYRYKLRYANPGGGGSGPSTTYISPSKGLEFAMTNRNAYGIIQVSNVDNHLSQNGGASEELEALEIEGAMDVVTETLAHSWFRSGSGIRGRVASIATNVMTLTVAADVLYFTVGLPIAATSSVAGTGQRSGTTTVASIDPDAGTVTLTNAAAISGLTTNDYLLRPLDGSDQTNCTGVMEGFSALIPDASPTNGESFRGADRSSDPARNAGLRIATNTNGLDIEALTGLLATKVYNFGQKPEWAIVNGDNFFKVANRLNAKRVFNDVGADAESGFSSLDLNYPGGSLKFYCDPFARSTVVSVGRWDEIEIKHSGGTLVHSVVDGTGVPGVRDVGTDSTYYMIRSISNLAIYKPSCFGVAVL